MIVQTVGLSDFRDAFRACNRSDNFSYEGKKEIVMDYLNDNTSLCGETSQGSFVYAVF